jgi:outer membrane receptor protein involved in Fe transport
VNYVGDRNDFTATGVPPIANNPNYTVVGATVTYSFRVPIQYVQRAAVFGRVGNLFDRNYDDVLGFKSPPINGVVGARVTF